MWVCACSMCFISSHAFTVGRAHRLIGAVDTYTWWFSNSVRRWRRNVHHFQVSFRLMCVPCIVLAGLNVRPLSVQPGYAGSRMCLGVPSIVAWCRHSTCSCVWNQVYSATPVCYFGEVSWLVSCDQHQLCCVNVYALSYVRLQGDVFMIIGDSWRVESLVFAQYVHRSENLRCCHDWSWSVILWESFVFSIVCSILARLMTTYNTRIL